MKVIKKGRKFVEITCPVCGAVLEYDGSDIKIEKTLANVALPVLSSTPSTSLYNEWHYIICPECNHKIYIKETLVR